MLRSLALPTALLGTVLLLASCGSAPTPGGTGTGNAGAGGGTGGNVVIAATPVVISRTITLGLPQTPDAELLVPATLASRVSAQVQSAPAGLSVTAGKPSQTTTGDTRIPLQVSGTASSGAVVTVKVTVGGTVSTAELPVVAFTSTPIQAPELSASYTASSMKFQPDGTLLLTSALSGEQAARQGVLQRKPDGTLTLLPFPTMTQYGEAISSEVSAPDGSLWVTVRGTSKEGSYLLSRDPAGTIKKFLVDAAGDTVNNATLTPDGRVWFTQYTNSSLKALNTGDGSVKKYSVPEKADSLVYGADANLYYASFFARPAIVQVNPSTGSTTSFNVGEAGRSLPTALTPAPDGSVWFIESLTGTVWQLNPKTGQQKLLTLPVEASPTALAVSASGQVWVSDATNARLYTTYRNSAGTQVLLGIGTPASGAHALTLNAQGKAWFEAGGKLYAQQ